MTLEDMLRYDEGRVLKVYWDHLGYPTVGIGHLIMPQKTTDMALINHTLSKQVGRQVNGVITESECSALFSSDLKNVQTEIQRYSNIKLAYDSCDDTRKKAICNMMFQMGGPRLSGFKKSLAFIVNREWSKAYSELLDSSWAKQTPARAKRVARVILTGTMDSYE